MPQRVKTQIVREVFSDSMPKNRNEAEDELRSYFDHSIVGKNKYADKTAVHLAAESVADSLYGGEHGNELFAIFPADFIASQHAFAFNTGESNWTFTKPCPELNWNDVSVWPKKFGGGISLDAGVTFLPKSILVDPETGSRYVSEEREGRRVQIEDSELSTLVTKYFSNPDYLTDELVANDITGTEEQVRLVRQSLIELGLHNRAEQLLGELGYSYLIKSICSTIVKSSLSGRGQNIIDELRSSRLLNKVLSKENGGVPAEDFWNQYFIKYPNRKPKHIIYYDGSPEEAVSQLFVDYGIRPNNSKSEPLLGFEENLVRDIAADARSNPEREMIDTLCNQILDEMFPEQ